MSEGADRIAALSAAQKRALLEEMLREKAAPSAGAAPNAGAALAAGAEARAAGRGGFVFPAEYAGFARAFEDSDDGGAADLFFQLCEG